VSGVGCLQHMGTLDLNAFSAAEVNSGWGVKAEAGMAVLMVVPVKEALTERAAVFDGAEPSGELRPVLEGFELCF
jgi:hypothetical protein